MYRYVIPSIAEYSIAYIDHILYTHSSYDGYLGCLHFLAIMNNAVVYIHV